jgi:uncharacterized protein YkvS
MTKDTRAKIPVEVRVIYDKSSYRCEFRETGAMQKATSGDFLKTDRGTKGRVQKLFENVADGVAHLAAMG